MSKIITNIEDLTAVAEPLKFLNEDGTISKEEGTDIITKIKDVMNADSTILALSAPQIGINKRIFCIKFNEEIKTFINPIVTKKSKHEIRPESFISMPGKEILITRPEELTVVYYTDTFEYEENKLLGAAARVFDQHCQLLDGVTPADLGLVSDVETDGSLADLSEEEIIQVTDIYKQYIKIKADGLKAQIKEDEDLAAAYKQLMFTEKVINGDAAVVAGENSKVKEKASNVATYSIHKAAQNEKQYNKAKLETFLRKRGK